MQAFIFWEPSAEGITLADRCNPYAGLLAAALSKLGIRLEMGDYGFGRGWLEANQHDHQALHLNWLHHFYRADDLEGTLKRYTAFAENLAFARSLGYRVVWTIHNLYPHERPFPEVDRLCRLLVSRSAHAVVAHCEYAAGLARKLFYREDGLHVIPHGHFIDVFPREITRTEARRRLGLPQDAFVYLYFGNARTYKGIEGLIDAFCRVAADDARLVLMMRRAFNTEYADEVTAHAGKDGRIGVHTSPFFGNEEFQIYLNACDVTVFPFSHVLTSGSAIAALSFGKPVIAPRLGCLPELLDDTMGILYDPKDEKGLDNALIKTRSIDLEAAGSAAHNRALSLDWDDIAARVAELYRG